MAMQDSNSHIYICDPLCFYKSCLPAFDFSCQNKQIGVNVISISNIQYMIVGVLQEWGGVRLVIPTTKWVSSQWFKIVQSIVP